MRGGQDPVEDCLKPLGGDVLDVGLAGFDRGDLAGVNIDGDDVLARLGKRHDEREPHVSKPNYPNGHST